MEANCLLNYKISVSISTHVEYPNLYEVLEGTIDGFRLAAVFPTANVVLALARLDTLLVHRNLFAASYS